MAPNPCTVPSTPSTVEQNPAQLNCEVETASINFDARQGSPWRLGTKHGLHRQCCSCFQQACLCAPLQTQTRWTGISQLCPFIYMRVMHAYLTSPDPDFLLAIKFKKFKSKGGTNFLTLPTLMIVQSPKHMRRNAMHWLQSMKPQPQRLLQRRSRFEEKY